MKATNLLGRHVLPQPWVVSADLDRKPGERLWPFVGETRADGTPAPGEIVGIHLTQGEAHAILRSVVTGNLSKSTPLAWLRIVTE